MNMAPPDKGGTLALAKQEKNVDRIGKNGYLWGDTILDGLRYYEKKRKYMINALKHTSGRDSFINQINEVDIGFITDEKAER